MSFSPQLADIRFGYGLSPLIEPPQTPQAVLDGLRRPDAMARQFPIPVYEVFRPRLVELTRLRQKANRNSSDTTALEAFRALRREHFDDALRWSARTMLRAAYTPTAFRERLVAFWADHFTAYGKSAIAYAVSGPYIEEAIRPNITGYFADMLVAAASHPVMLQYLDQNRSVGPGSVAARRNPRLDGLNENLAREVLELHTLGVGGPYRQDDVRQLAELFTGMTHSYKAGFQFRANFAEPGPETVLGREYGRDQGGVEPIRRALRDISVHPVTARHLAHKLAVHFVSDAPPADLVNAMVTAYLDTGGSLLHVYAVLLGHPAAWETPMANVKPPADFIASGFRALAPAPERIENANLRDLRRVIARPLQVMGQPWQRPPGPDGWSEADSAWITPQGVAARLRWSMVAPRILQRNLPEPEQFAETVLGPFSNDRIRFAASAAESRSDGIGLVLASPAFQRR